MVQATPLNLLVKSHLALLLCNIIWACDYPFYNLVLSKYVAPIALVTASLCAAALFSLVPLLWSKAKPIARKDIKTMIGAALLIGVIRKVLLMYGLSRTSPIDGSIIDTITPLLVLLISVVLGIDKFTRLKIAGLVLGMAGAVGVVLLGASGGHTHSGLVGNLMIAGCALATSCYMVWFKKLVYCLAALMVLPFGARELVHTDFAAMDTDILLATLFVVFVPTYVPNLLLNYSLKYVQPTVSSIYTYLQPVLAVVLSVAMGLDRLHLDTALCALVIFFGVGLVIRSYRGPAVPSAPLPVHTH